LRLTQEPGELGLGSTALHKFCAASQPKACGAIVAPAIASQRSVFMNSIIYLVGLVVVILAILSFFGLR
jgi:hypothetical protein